jgi:hypothetical protein
MESGAGPASSARPTDAQPHRRPRLQMGSRQRVRPADRPAAPRVAASARRCQHPIGDPLAFEIPLSGAETQADQVRHSRSLLGTFSCRPGRRGICRRRCAGCRRRRRRRARCARGRRLRDRCARGSRFLAGPASAERRTERRQDDERQAPSRDKRHAGGKRWQRERCGHLRCLGGLLQARPSPTSLVRKSFSEMQAF